MKNENGTGSIYKMKGKRKRPWVARVTTGYTTDGKQLRKVVGTFTTKREAQEILIGYIKNPKLFSKDTFKDVKALWWTNYSKRVTHNIKLFDLQTLFDKMTTSWSFKNGCKSVLNMIFDYALKNEFIETNKIKFIEIGKREKVIIRKIFTKEEIGILWGNLDSNYTYILLILIYTGMRIGEFLNLKNTDIDFLNNTIRVRVSKTSAGIRVIPIAKKIIDLFKNNLVESREYFLTGETTIQLSYATFNPRFNKLLRDLGIQPHTIHDTRHTFATLLNNANANHSSITKLIGHSNFAITENIYTHKDTEELRKAVELIY